LVNSEIETRFSKTDKILNFISLPLEGRMSTAWVAGKGFFKIERPLSL
jgi:hypothetical protein